MKVLFITYEFGGKIQGGIARVINGISNKLIPKIDLDILLINTTCKIFNVNLLSKNLEIFIKFRKYRVYQHRHSKIKTNCRTRFKTTLLDLINKEDYDIVHLFHIGDYQELAIQIIRQHCPELKIVYSCHSIAKYDIKLRKSYSNQLGYEDFILNNIDHLHLLNYTSLDYLKKNYHQMDKAIPYTIIPNGIDESDYCKKSSKFNLQLQKEFNNKGKINILCMSRWCFGKGLEYLLDAIPKVIENHPNVRIIMAGRKGNSWENGVSSYIKILDEKIKEFQDYVTVFGWLNDEERNTLLSYADIWIMPSLLEYFPYSILEPMIAQIPIISARIDSVQEMLEENQECLFYHPTDSNELATQIIKLINDENLRSKLAKKAYLKAKEIYQWDKISEMYEKMYQEIIAGVSTHYF